jgi:anti-sigma factor RsiW
MNVNFECGDNAALVSYLYGECTPAEQKAVAAHLPACPACTAELAALSSTRLQLASWIPPEADLGFRIVSEARTSNVVRPARWWQQAMPVWAQAAAAVVLFGVGLSLGVMRGSVPPATSTTSTTAVTQAAPAATLSDLQALEQRLRGELSQVRAAAETRSPVVTAAPTGSDAEVLARVRALIDESEQRQRRELALRTAEVVRDVDAQRQVDWTRVQRAMGQFEGTAGAELQRQRQELNNLIRVSQRPQ